MQRPPWDHLVRAKPPPLVWRLAGVAAVLTAMLWTLAGVGPARSSPLERVPIAASTPAHEPVNGEQGPSFTMADRESLTRELDAYLDGHEGRLALSLHDLASGTTFNYGGEERFVTASIVKVNILAILLLQAEDEGRGLTREERTLAEEMIRFSDNDAADALYGRIGFTEGFRAGNERLGLTSTEPGAGGVWGATETTTVDQLRLWRSIATDNGLLSEESREYAGELLASVAPEQSWGISVAAGAEDTMLIKNGWVPRESDQNRWAVNSTGYVYGPDRALLVTVLSDHHFGYESGIACIEHVVAESVLAVTGEDPRERASV